MCVVPGGSPASRAEKDREEADEDEADQSQSHVIDLGQRQKHKAQMVFSLPAPHRVTPVSLGLSSFALFFFCHYLLHLQDCERTMAKKQTNRTDVLMSLSFLIHEHTIKGGLCHIFLKKENYAKSIYMIIIIFYLSAMKRFHAGCFY